MNLMKPIGVKMTEEEKGKEGQTIGETMTGKMKRDKKEKMTGKMTEEREEIMTEKTGKKKEMIEERKEEKDLEMEEEEVPTTGKEETLDLKEDPTVDLEKEVEHNPKEESIEEGAEMNPGRFTPVKSLKWKVRMKEAMTILFLSLKLKILQSLTQVAQDQSWVVFGVESINNGSGTSQGSRITSLRRCSKKRSLSLDLVRFIPHIEP